MSYYLQGNLTLSKTNYGECYIFASDIAEYEEGYFYTTKITAYSDQAKTQQVYENSNMMIKIESTTESDDEKQKRALIQFMSSFSLSATLMSA